MESSLGLAAMPSGHEPRRLTLTPNLNRNLRLVIKIKIKSKIRIKSHRRFMESNFRGLRPVCEGSNWR
jgi:hypothetical protein